MRHKYHLHVSDGLRYSSWMGIGHSRDGVHTEGCCECSLVHDTQYRVLVKVDGRWQPMDRRTIVIQKRVRKNSRRTAAMRRHRHPDGRIGPSVRA